MKDNERTVFKNHIEYALNLLCRNDSRCKCESESDPRCPAQKFPDFCAYVDDIFKDEDEGENK
jgi:hypothetical protein